MKTRIVLVVIFILLAVMNAAAQEARFTELTGTVDIKDAGEQEWKHAEVGTLIGKDSVISTGIKSTAVISLGASTITVSPLTMLTLEELIQQDGTEEAILYLRTGRVKADVSPPSGLKAEFTVRSPTTTASVRGTSFSFNGKQVSVSSGRVQLANKNGQKVFVNENQRSYADSNQNHRLVLPFEAESAGVRPVFNDLDNTGSKKDSPQKQTPGIRIEIDWS